MDLPHRTLPISYRVESSNHPLSHMARLATALGAALVSVLCVVVLIRGLLRSFDVPASPLLLVVAALVTEAVVSFFRMIWLRLHPQAMASSALLARLAIPSFCVLCIAVAMSLTGATVWSVAMCWLVVAGGESAWWYPVLRTLQLHGLERTGAVSIRFESPQASAQEADDASIDKCEEFDQNMIQRITRSRNDNGIEFISGILRAEFVGGERSHNLHVAFCPPLAYEPAILVHQLEGPPLAIKIAQAEVFGTRIELRRVASTELSETAMICFEVQPRQSVPASAADPSTSYTAPSKEPDEAL